MEFELKVRVGIPLGQNVSAETDGFEAEIQLKQRGVWNNTKIRCPFEADPVTFQKFVKEKIIAIINDEIKP